MVDFKKPAVALKLPRLTGEGNERHTDRMALLGLGVTIAYKTPSAGIDYPTDAQKATILAAAKRARKILRAANDELAKVVLLRAKESQNFTATMATHFGLTQNDTAGGFLKDNIVDKKFSFRAVLERDRRWVLNQIRENMLSLSFHLNTGMYLIDQDVDNRDIYNGVANRAGLLSKGNEAYVYIRAEGALRHMCGFRNGEIHVDIKDLQNYSQMSCARVIIHEAAHKYLAAKDHFYAWDANYAALRLQDRLTNADSYAWAALSLYSGTVKMPTANSQDWTNC